MLMLVAITVGLVFWITAWALGMNANVAILVTIALALMAFVVQLVTPWAKEQFGRTPR